jgi:hypothetical protein
MARVVIVFAICLIGQSLARADELQTGQPNHLSGAGTTALARAISVEAGRLARSRPTERGFWSTSQTPTDADTRHPCVRHGTACGALIGYSVGFLAGLMNPPDDFEPMGFALVFSGPIGAGVGAAVGWGIAEGTKPRRGSP